MAKPQTQSISIAPDARCSVAAFGKHPGWNDHMDDLGLETEALVAFKRTLYTNGISGVIDGGAWEKLDDDKRVDAFDHSFVARLSGAMIVGRMWSSTDGRGRQKYPMVVCAEVIDRPMSFIADKVLPRLRQLEAECRQADSASAVISLLDAARAELRSAASTASSVSPDPLPPPGAAAMLIDNPAMGTDAVGLKRIIYQVERDLKAYLAPDGKPGTKSRSRTTSIDFRPQHIRVP
ncbi:MAG: hypothetical protein AAF235_07245, partial [Planctomycetota bacterium]